VIKLKDLLYEQLDEDKYRLVIIFHYDPEYPDDLDVAKRWEPEAKKVSSEHYMVEMDGAYINKNDNAITIHNAGDKDGFVIEPENTLVLVKEVADATKKMSWLDEIISLERSGIFCVNPSQCKRICADKYLSMLYFADNGLRQPKTILVGNEKTVLDDFERLETQYPIIMKTSSGTQGVGVLFVESERSLLAITQLVFKLDKKVDLLLQEYIKTSYDVRVHVLHGEVLGAMKREVIPGDFRSNYSQGSETLPFDLTKLEEEDCIKAAKAVDGIWVGVDFIPSEDRENESPFMLEVNSNPGTSGIEKTLNKNIALDVLESFKDRSNWLKPEPFKSIYD
tara:strand:+ start:189 stop:1199 length:1011 start_codon:yes stop_codon:yes gene_type:complete